MIDIVFNMMLSAALQLSGAAAEAHSDTTVTMAAGTTEAVQLSVRGAVLKGTLHVPLGAGPHPAAVLMPGARTSRFLPGVAEHLAAHGVAVLDLHKRGVGGSTGRWDRQSFRGRAEDMHAALAFLRGRPDIDASRVGVIGHSQGGWIAQIVAARDADLAFAVLLAGPAQTVRDQILTDERIQRERRGVPPEQVAREMSSLSRQLSLAGTVRPVCNALRARYICRIIDFDPKPYLESLRTPLLAIFGELDPMVPPEPNIPLLCAGLARAGNEDVTLHVFPRANHDFLEARTGLWDEYHELSREYVPGFLDMIGGWLGARGFGTAAPSEVPAETSCGDGVAADDAAAEDLPLCDVTHDCGTGDSAATEQARHTLLPRPIVFHTEETRWAAGLTVLHTYTPAAPARRGRPTTSSLSVFGTQSGQTDAHAAIDHYAGAYRVTAATSYGVQPAIFHGIGRDLPLENGEPYTARGSALNVAVRRRVASHLSVGGDIGLRRLQVSDAPDGGLLRGGAIPGAAGGSVRSIAGVVTLDSRDHVHASRSGVYSDIRVRRGHRLLGSDYEFTSISVDTRTFAAAARHVAALQVVFTTSSGDVPFQLMPRLGGETLLRGVDPRRHRDRTVAALQAEYRTPLVRRLGAVAFAGAGTIGPDVRGLAADAPVMSAGAGLRFLIRSVERLHLRADFAVGDRERRVHVGVGEAF